MSPRTEKALNWIALIGIATLFGAGTAWGVTTARLATLEQKVDRIDRRVALLYCGSIPTDQQERCKEQLVP